VEHVQSGLRAIYDANPRLCAFVAIAGDEVLKDAEAADLLIRERGPAAWQDKPLLGVTVSVKDLIQTQDLPTMRGSSLENRRARVDAPAVARLRAAGAIVIGKTATSEYGWSASTASPVAPSTRNPWNLDRSAGGSSGGAAASVAARLCTAALGTDGAGSIRIPASFCGVVGYKPSFGRIPYVPVCADRLAHLGPLAMCVADVVELTNLMTGPHHADPASMIGPLERVRDTSSPLRIGWIEFPGTEPTIRALGEQVRPLLTECGYLVEHIDVPFADPYPALVDILAAAEAAGTTPADEELCDPGRLAIVGHGRTVTGAAVMRAEETRAALQTTLTSVMSEYDLLAMATVPIEPFGVDAIAPKGMDTPEDLLWLAWSPASYPFNMTGQPALSLPVGLSPQGLPIGLQLVGPWGGDDLVLSAAARIEANLGPLEPAMKG
jgi:aspartyl-tRNA(Asn)/glutamyl-tRNA(Gln) amidotransferase subunit A